MNPPIVFVDFNDLEGDIVFTARDNVGAGRTMARDDLVDLHEGQSVSCWAHVVDVTPHLVSFRVIWETWRDDSVRVAGERVNQELLTAAEHKTTTHFSTIPAAKKPTGDEA